MFKFIILCFFIRGGQTPTINFENRPRFSNLGHVYVGLSRFFYVFMYFTETPIIYYVRRPPLFPPSVPKRKRKKKRENITTFIENLIVHFNYRVWNITNLHDQCPPLSAAIIENVRYNLAWNMQNNWKNGGHRRRSKPTNLYECMNHTS